MAKRKIFGGIVIHPSRNKKIVVEIGRFVTDSAVERTLEKRFYVYDDRFSSFHREVITINRCLVLQRMLWNRYFDEKEKE